MVSGPVDIRDITHLILQIKDISTSKCNNHDKEVTVDPDRQGSNNTRMKYHSRYFSICSVVLSYFILHAINCLKCTIFNF